MNGSQNPNPNPNPNPKQTPIPRNLIWGGAIAGVAIVLIAFVVMFMSSSETPDAFLARWKSTLESGNLKKYEGLWLPNARRKYAQDYKRTAELLQTDSQARLEVNLSGAPSPRRVPRYPSRSQFEGIPLVVHFPGESQQQVRNLTIERKGIIQKRWKIVRDEVVGQEFATVDTTPQVQDTEDTSEPTATPPNSPVVPLVQAWKNALESQDVKKYTGLWDKSAQKKQKANFQSAKRAMSQAPSVDLSQATYVAVPGQKERHIVSDIGVTLYDGGTPIETHSRTLTIAKKGFIWKKWKLINDEIGGEATNPEPVVQYQEPTTDTVSGEESGGTFAGNAPVDTQLKVRQVLGKWQSAWEGKDIETYMSTYAARAQITRVTVSGGGKGKTTYLTKAQLRAKMQRLNQMYAEIQVTISNLQINGDRAVADVTFLQKFKGTPASGTRPAYSDYGTKKLNLMVDPADGHWKIYAESWSYYEDVPEFPKM